ncbi:teichoic acids export ABC transporter permease subunit TagG [Bacillus atrophaeus]|uniref:teichoic acids export ABC transporter permease subunit TagG n=1 Tax=Bacillus atrophaeus TaxID=1452 RepID=UPI000D0289D1|nr:teichoic acids export ABC transporter permease subunit TagG [Bacillus atrophaeus]MCY7945877.1 teichoic acids export ABC transporter permease subunit TagG [Bacillus atrophaeus]MCY8097496.1 teichoic acids export ABC transporter permease subunit TagG [Bacillus atrophaeus]MCY8506964.1 teichoic acids export ABC transporter permease subunit TagG [Bacillus atrophaeus]MCY8520396.1 teichoic acids export ABC transporter permease subunit TagG [Bacillus atrophaeus]MCY8523902.1 teichoic acids export ABC
MNALVKILKEQITSFPLILRLAAYETKSKYQMNYLGVLWQFLNPLIQMLAYWFVFGLGIRKGGAMATGAGEVPFIVWMLAGLIPWFFISPTILDGSNSVFKRIKMVAKMNFPISSLPSVAIAANMVSYFIMTAIYVIVLLACGIYPGLHWLQYIYYFICMIAFLFAFSLFNSTISVLIRDYQFLLQAVTRLLFFLLPIFWDISDKLGTNHPELLPIVKLNPLFYIIDGFRNSFLDGQWFFHDIKYMLYFWLFTLLLLTVGSILHMKFRDKFVDFL